MSASRRRSQGEGSVHRRKDGLWTGVINLGWHDGKRKRKQVYGHTEREVMQKLAQLRRAAEQGQDLLQMSPTLAEWLDEWLLLKEAQGTRPLTMRSYRMLARMHVVPALGRGRLDKLTPTQVRKLVESKSAQGLSPATVGQIHGLIRNALADAERHELVSRNVAKAVRPPSKRPVERRFLTLAEARHLLDVIRGGRLEALWICALSLGLRRGELLGLFWADIDWERGMIRVRRAVQRANGLNISALKTRRSERFVPMPEATAKALRDHRERQLLEAQFYGWADLPDAVFVSTKGTLLDPDNASHQWDRVRKEAGLPWLRLHDLRHACASMLLASGASPRTVMQILGHSQIGLTMNTYAHVLPEVERQAMDDLGSSLFGPSGL